MVKIVQFSLNSIMFIYTIKIIFHEKKISNVSAKYIFQNGHPKCQTIERRFAFSNVHTVAIFPYHTVPYAVNIKLIFDK